MSETAKEVVDALQVEGDVDTASENVVSEDGYDPGEVSKSSHIEEDSVESVDDDVVLGDSQVLGINKHYEELLEQISTDESLRSLGPEISFILKKFQMMYSMRKQLLHKVSELNAQLLVEKSNRDNYEKVLCEKDELIESLKASIESLERVVHECTAERDSAIEALEVTMKQLEEMKHLARCTTLREEVPDEDLAASEMKNAEEIEEMIADLRLEFHAEIAGLKHELETKENEVCSLQNQLNSAKLELEECREELASAKNNLQAEVDERVRVEREISEARDSNKDKTDNIMLLEARLKEVGALLEASDARVRTQEEDNQKYKRTLEQLTKSHNSLKAEFDVQEQSLSQAMLENSAMLSGLKEKDAEIKRLKQNISCLEKEKVYSVKHVTSLENFKSQARSEIETLGTERAGMLKQLDSHLKQCSEYEKERASMRREKELMSAKITKLEQAVLRLQSEVKMKTESKKILNTQLQSTLSNLDREKKRLKESEIEKDRLLNEITDLQRTLDEHKKEISLSKIQMSGLEKNLSDCERKLRAETELKKDISSDLFQCKKTLRTYVEEIEKEKSRTEASNNYIESLKANIRNQEIDHIALTKKMKRLEEELNAMKVQLTKETARASQAQSNVRKVEEHVQALQKGICLKDRDLNLLKIELVGVTEEMKRSKDIVSAKNKDMKALEDKLKQRDSDLATLQNENRIKTKDICLLKMEQQNAARSNGLLRKKVEKLDVLKRELISNRQLLIQEQMSRRALEENATKQTNVHKMRLIACEDPDKQSMQLKLQFLLRKLGEKQTELRVKESELETQKKRADEMESKMKSISSTGFHCQLATWKAKCRQLQDRCDSLTAQANMYECQYVTLQNENNLLKENLSKLKTNEYLENLKSRKPKK